MKKAMMVTLSSLSCGLGLLGISGMALADGVPTEAAPQQQWVAKTPNQIGALNANGTYTVQAGDTIWAIGVHFNVKPSVIEQVNNITNPYDLRIGTVLKIRIDQANDQATIEATAPDGSSHSVTLQPKDKLNPNKKFGEDVTNNATTAVQPTPSTPSQPAQKNTGASVNQSTATQQKEVTRGTLAPDTHKQYQAGSTETIKPRQSGATASNTANNSIPAEVVATLAYYDAYRDTPGTIDKNYQLSKMKDGQYYLYQGGASGATVSVNRNNVTMHISGVTKQYDANQLINKYYNNDTNCRKINAFVNEGIHNAQKQ